MIGTNDCPRLSNASNLCPCSSMTFFDAENLDSVTTTRNIKIRIPCTSYKCGLYVERIIPTNIKFKPTFNVDGRSICHVLHANLCFVDKCFVGTSYHTNPSSRLTSTRSGQRPHRYISPALDRYFTIVNDNLFVQWFHNRTTDRHLWNLDTFEELIMFSNLTVEVKVFL